MSIENILTSAHIFNKEEYELKLRYILFNSLIIFNVILVSIAMFTRLIYFQYTQATVDLIYIIFALVIFLNARKSKINFTKLVNYVIFLSIIIVTLTFYEGIDLLAGLSWYIVLLMTAFFLSGSKIGNMIFLVSIVLIILISITKHHYEAVQISLGIIPFFVALFFMYFFEKINNDFKDKLELINKQLLKQNDDFNHMLIDSRQELVTSKQELFTLQQVVDKAPVSIIITDIDGVIEYSNPAFAKLTGYSEGEFIGQNPKILKSNLHSDEYYEKLWSTITSGNIWNGTFKNIAKNGNEYWESAIIAPINDDNAKLSHFIAVKQEITKEVYLTNELKEKEKEKIENSEKTLESFVSMLEERDTYTAGHSQRVAKYSLLIAQEMKFSEEECDLVYRSAILHDIGKIATPDNVLLKPGSLTDLEYKLIQEHVSASFEILFRIPMYKDLAHVIICHHERYDGKGYPKGLHGDEMPVLYQIMILADAFDAMTTNRIYKGRKTVDDAIEELLSASGKQFHPLIVEDAVKVLKDIELEDMVTQLPQTDLEKERFSYFFRDQVTQVYNSDYLMFTLNQNIYNIEYKCINVLYMHDFSKYNNKYGWSEGDKLLNRFANYLIDNFKSSRIFRIYGDDFVLMSKESLQIDMQQFVNLELLNKYDITVTHRQINLSKEDILTIDDLALPKLMDIKPYQRVQLKMNSLDVHLGHQKIYEL